MGLDFKQSAAKRKVLQTLQSEAYKQTFPYGARTGELSMLMGKGMGESYLSEVVGYLRMAGLVVTDKLGRHMAADSENAQAAPLTKRTATAEEMERIRAGVPSSGPLTPKQQEKLDAYRKEHA